MLATRDVDADIVEQDGGALRAGDTDCSAEPHEQWLLPIETIFLRYLSRTPIAYALFRAAECRALSTQRVRRPTLDLGCGAGEFAGWAVRCPLDMGIDLSRDRLASARRASGHRLLLRADAGSLPVHGSSVMTVVALSVCEHLRSPAQVLAEVFRALRPSGVFIATIMLSDAHRHLFWPRVFRWLRLPRAARHYVTLNDKVFQHRALHTGEAWHEALVTAGFQIVASRRIVSPRLMRAFDFLLCTAWPYRVLRRFGDLPIWRPRWFQRILWRWAQRIIADAPADGSVLFVVAQKPG